MADSIASYPDVILHGLNNRRILGANEEVVIAPSSSKARIVFSPPLSRSPSPLNRQREPQVEVEPRVLGQKTLDFFSNPFTTSSPFPTPIHEARPITPTISIDSSSSEWSSSFSSSTSFDDDPDRPPSPVRPDSVTYGFFFKEHVPPPAELPPPRTGLLKIPKLERFFPSRVGRRSTRDSIIRESADLTLGNSAGDFLLIDPNYNTVGIPPPCVTPTLKIDVEPIGSPGSSIRDFVMLEDLPSMVSSPVPSSPVAESLTPLTPSPPRTPDSPTPKAEREEVQFEELKLDGPIVFAEGMIIGNELPLQLIRLLGIGAFSNVWLARDILHKLEHVGDRPKTDIIKKRERLEARRGDRTAHGLRPPTASHATGASLGRSSSIYLKAKSAVADSDKNTMTQDDHDHGRLVALKIIDRALCESDDRTRISFMREVEILRHISHPSIVSYLYSFSIPTHHCLVLEALQGGELFDLMGQEDNYARMTEPLVRRIFGELCHAVGWMHSVDLVHRDVKLENILFTTNPFLPNAVLPPPTRPLIKLTDFGLARFIDPAQPILTTRCGSESYAAPEIIMCKPYDGRQTDAWACGVLLYALATCTLPFDNPPNGAVADTRRAFLSRIARVGYSWPSYEEAPLATDGLRDVVSRLLVKDPVRRATLAEVWDEPWMRGDGAPPPPIEAGKLVGGEVPLVAREE